jgi:hypothetical protein
VAHILQKQQVARRTVLRAGAILSFAKSMKFIGFRYLTFGDADKGFVVVLGASA